MFIALWCWITPSRMLSTYPPPMKANMPITATTAAVANAGILNSCSRSNGEALRDSIRRNPANATTPRPKATRTLGWVQPLIGPWITPYSTASAESAIAAWPGQSAARPSGADESSTSAALSPAENSATSAQVPNTQ